MQTTSFAATIAQELQAAVAQISRQETAAAIDKLLSVKRIFVAGAGRSGLMGRAFAMRLMHSGLEAYVVGETVTPGIDASDALVIGSGSGETKTLVAMAEKAKSLGAAVIAVTIKPESTIGRLADLVVQLPGVSKEQADSAATVQPMGSLYEQTLLVWYDSVVLGLMTERGLDTAKMYGKHANLE